MAKKNYVLDTSACLTDADSIFKFDNHDIFIPLKVLEEIDKHKKRQDMVGINARKIIRSFDELRKQGPCNYCHCHRRSLFGSNQKDNSSITRY